jgi:hypothetical protein
VGLPVIVCLRGADGGYIGHPLPDVVRDGLGVTRGDLTLQELTGDTRPETLISYVFPGGSASHELVYVYRWDGAAQPQLIFNAALTTWAGTSTWELAPDGAQPGAQQIVLTYPHLYADGFDHKMLNHPLARQIWRWDGAEGRFNLAEETIRTPEMSWGPQPEETVEDWLRWTVNGAELAFRSGDYPAALEGYEEALGMTAGGWTPADDQPDWAGYARFRRAETLALLGDPVASLSEMQGVAAHYGADILGELAEAFLSGYGDGSAADAAALGVGAMQGVDLYSHLYWERGGALRFPLDAPGILYPGAGLAAYLDARPELSEEPTALAEGLQTAAFDGAGVERSEAVLQITLRLPDVPNAEGAWVVWRLARSGDSWSVAPAEPDPAAPGGLSEPGWPAVGGFPAPRYAPQEMAEP